MTHTFGKGVKVSQFKDAGVMQDGEVFTCRATPVYSGKHSVLGDKLVSIGEVPSEFFIEDNLSSWEYLKGGKRSNEPLATDMNTRIPKDRWRSLMLWISRVEPF